jgi:hypothetical protein
LHIAYGARNMQYALRNTNLLLASDEEPFVTGGFQHPQVLMPDFFAPAGHIVLGIDVAGPDLQHLADFDAADALLGLQQRAGQAMARARRLWQP